MRPTERRIMQSAAGILATAAVGATAHAQSSDALIDKLVDKGILTSKEAQELREETDKNFNTAYAVKSGMPDWVTSFKINGDVRGRYEGFWYANESTLNNGLTVSDRQRFRYRLRAGFTAVMADNLEAGFRLTSSDGAGDPISGNTSYENNGSKKPIWFDLAYGKWTPLNTPVISSTITVGKMENPFVFSDSVFDGDYTPEGGALQFNINASDKHVIKVNGGVFALDELKYSSHDPVMYGVQARWDATWSPKVATTLGVSYLSIQNPDRLDFGPGVFNSGVGVPNINSGNTRDSLNRLAYDMVPVVGDAAVTYTLASFPFYTGAFPIKMAGEYIYNNGAPSDMNYGYSVGLTLGKAGKKGLWELTYRWKELRSDMWYEEFTDSDFGAFYWGQLPNSGKAAFDGFSGTNVRGHVIKGVYNLYDSFSMGFTLFLTELVNDSTLVPPAGLTDQSSDQIRLQVDAIWKF